MDTEPTLQRGTRQRHPSARHTVRILVEHSCWLVCGGIGLGCVLSGSATGPSRQRHSNATQRH